MAYLLFLDESGHDHQTCPYEVRGGIALHAGQLWPFIQAVRSAEESAFGNTLASFGSEIKGRILLDKDRFRWAKQRDWLDGDARRKHATSFLAKGHAGRDRIEHTAYGQACITLARDIFRLLHEHYAMLFASVIPAKVARPTTPRPPDLLRKDHVRLFERFFYFLEEKRDQGLLVFDETDKVQDRKFVARLHRYFTRTDHGRLWSAWIVPAPLFVSSDMTYPVQAADICIYCINWGFRLPSMGMNGQERKEISQEFGPLLARLQYQGDVVADRKEFHTYGIAYVPDPYSEWTQKKEEATPSEPPPKRQPFGRASNL